MKQLEVLLKVWISEGLTSKKAEEMLKFRSILLYIKLILVDN